MKKLILAALGVLAATWVFSHHRNHRLTGKSESAMFKWWTPDV
jgi:hypothetical protein